MFPRRLATLAAAVLVVPAAVLGSAAVATGGPVTAGQAGSSCSSHLVQPVDPPHGASLFAVSVRSKCSAWAVGSRSLPDDEQALVEHWNGHTWQVRPIPSSPGTTSRLTGVAATGPRSALAVGFVTIPDTAAITTPLALAWNGRFWKRLTVPRIRGGSFNAVAAASPTNGWAVGDVQPNLEGGISPLIEHWNGHNWRRQPSAPTTGGSTLTSVTVLSPVNAWAVGFRPGLAVATIIEHWNGHVWRRVASASPGQSLLFAVAARSPASVWAVGDTQTDSRTKALTEHWNGNVWQAVPSRSPGSLENLLAGVTVLSRTDVWTVGFTSNKHRQTLVEHWNGHSWVVVPSDDPGGPSHDNLLLAVSGTNCANLWAVGFSMTSGVPAPIGARC